MYVEVGSLAQLFYVGENESRYIEEQSIRLKTRKGQNELTFKIPEMNINTSLIRFDPGCVAGEYKIQSIEIFEYE